MTSDHSSAAPRGEPLPDWRPPAPPPHAVLQGRHVRLEPLLAGRHAAALGRAFADADAVWDYLPYGPFATTAAFAAWLGEREASRDPQFYAIVDPASGDAVGICSYLRIDPPNGCIEIGHLAYAPRLQRSAAATEAIHLLLQQAFGLGYRRVEWKCNALNAASRRAAQRLGFSYEGLFRQAAVVKGRNRDTAWYAMLDREWAAIGAAQRRWLEAANFDAAGRQRGALGDWTRPLLAALG